MSTQVAKLTGEFQQLLTDANAARVAIATEREEALTLIEAERDEALAEVSGTAGAASGAANQAAQSETRAGADADRAEAARLAVENSDQYEGRVYGTKAELDAAPTGGLNTEDYAKVLRDESRETDGTPEVEVTYRWNGATWAYLYTPPIGVGAISRLPDRYLDELVRRAPNGVTTDAPGEALRTAIEYAVATGTRRMILEPSVSFGGGLDADGRRVVLLDRPIVENVSGMELIVESGLRLQLHPDATNPAGASSMLDVANRKGFVLRTTPDSIWDPNSGAFPDFGQGGSIEWGGASQPARKLHTTRWDNVTDCHHEGVLIAENGWSTMFVKRYENVTLGHLVMRGQSTDDNEDPGGFSNINASCLQIGEPKVTVYGRMLTVQSVTGIRVADPVDGNPTAQGVWIGVVYMHHAYEGLETSAAAGVVIPAVFAYNCQRVINNAAYSLAGSPAGTIEEHLLNIGSRSPGFHIGQVYAEYNSDWFQADGFTPVLTVAGTPIALVLEEGCHIGQATIMLRDVPGVVQLFRVSEGSSIDHMQVFGDEVSTLAAPSELRGGRVNLERLRWANVAAQPAIRVITGGSRLDVAAPEPLNDEPTSAAVEFAVTEQATRAVRGTVEEIRSSAPGTAQAETGRDSENFTVGDLLPALTTPWTPAVLGDMLWVPETPTTRVESGTLIVESLGGMEVGNQGDDDFAALVCLDAARYPTLDQGWIKFDAGDHLEFGSTSPTAGAGAIRSTLMTFSGLFQFPAVPTSTIRNLYGGGAPVRVEFADNGDGTVLVTARIEDSTQTTRTLTGTAPTGTPVAIGLHITTTQAELFIGLDGNNDPISAGTIALTGGMEDSWSNTWTLNAKSRSAPNDNTGAYWLRHPVMAPLSLARADVLNLLRFAAGQEVVL